jgi:hypothetical protein
MGFKLKYGEEYFGETIPAGLEAKFREDFINQIAQNIEESAVLDICVSFFAVLLEVNSLYSETLHMLNSWIQEAKLPEKTWREGEYCLVKLDPFGAGLIDGIANELKGLSDFVVIAYDYLYNPSYRSELNQGFSELDISSVVSSFWEEKEGQYGSGKMDEINHQVGSDLVAIVSIATGVKALYSSARGLLSAAVKSVGKLSSNLSKLIARYTKEGYEIIEDGGKYFAKKGDTLIELGEGAAKGGNAFKEITTDIATALKARINHIRKITFEPTTGGQYRFTGVHSKSAIDELGANARIEITIPKNAEGVYEAKVFAKGPNGIEIPKSGNQGKSTFFPDDWDEARILEEVEHAVRNNKGLVPDAAPNQYFGFSKNGRIKIEFYYDELTGNINSFFPSLKQY